MNSPQLFVRSVVLFAVACVPSTLAANPAAPSESPVPFTGRPHVERGMNRETVRAMLGVPSAHLSPDVWVYFDFQARRPVELRVNVANPENRGTLVIAFKGDRVMLIRLCDSQPVRAFLAQQAKTKPAAPAVAGR